MGWKAESPFLVRSFGAWMEADLGHWRQVKRSLPNLGRARRSGGSSEAIGVADIPYEVVFSGLIGETAVVDTFQR